MPNLTQAANKVALDKLQELSERFCLYPGCCNSRRSRGLCHGHFQNMRTYVKRGWATEEDLTARGLLLPKGSGGSPVHSNEALKLGSTELGKAARS